MQTRFARSSERTLDCKSSGRDLLVTGLEGALDW